MAGFTDFLKTIAPWVGAAVSGPLAPVVATVISAVTGDKTDAGGVQEVLKSLSSSEEGRIKLAQIESDLQIKILELGYTSLKDLQELEFKNVAEVNATMRAETTAENWPQYSWRPYNGFLFGTTIFANYFILPLLHIPPPSIPAEVWGTWGLILGVASFYRGKMQADPNIPAATKITSSSPTSLK